MNRKPSPPSLPQISDDTIVSAIERSHASPALWAALTYPSGPYSITKPTVFTATLVTQIAHAYAFKLQEEVERLQAQVRSDREVITMLQQRIDLERSRVDRSRQQQPEFGPWKVAHHPFKPGMCRIYRRSLTDPGVIDSLMDPRRQRPALFCGAGHAYGWILTQGMSQAGMEGTKP